MTRLQVARRTRFVAVVAALLVIASCAPSGRSSPSSSGSGASATSGRVVIVGRIVTMDEPAEVEALLIDDGTVTAVGTRDEVMALAGDQATVIDIGQNVAYPGFIDAHAHWIGDRDYYGAPSPAAAMEAAAERGWTSIAELWVDEPRLNELQTLDVQGGLPLRVDGYLRMNEPQLNGRHFGPWYEDRDPGAVSDHLHIQGLKFHLDTGFELDLLWDAEELTDKVVAANEAGWQVAMHTFSVEAQEQALDALEAAIGPSGPNPLHHRIEHNFQVTDEQLARMVAMQIPVVIHLDTAPVDWNSDPEWLAAYTGDTAWFTRWKDFVDAGLPAAGATDMPWILPEFQLTDDIGRPVDQVAGGMDPIGKVYAETPPWMANQLLTAEQGLRTVTLDAAYALQDEGKRGHLAPGTWGDVTILSGDLLDASPDEIREFSVIATIVGGEVIYCSDPAICPAD